MPYFRNDEWNEVLREIRNRHIEQLREEEWQAHLAWSESVGVDVFGLRAQLKEAQAGQFQNIPAENRIHYLEIIKGWQGAPSGSINPTPAQVWPKFTRNGSEYTLIYGTPQDTRQPLTLGLETGTFMAKQWGVYYKVGSENPANPSVLIVYWGNLPAQKTTQTPT